MGWHAGIAAIRGEGLDVAAVAAALGLERRGDQASFESATSSGARDCCLAQQREWVVAANVMNWYWLIEDHGDYLRGLAAELPRAEIFFFLLEGTSSSYVFGAARDGAVFRETVVTEGERVVDEGVPTAWEAVATSNGESLEEDGEGFVLGLLAAIVAPFEELDAVPFATYAPP